MKAISPTARRVNPGAVPAPTHALPHHVRVTAEPTPATRRLPDEVPCTLDAPGTGSRRPHPLPDVAGRHTARDAGDTAADRRAADGPALTHVSTRSHADVMNHASCPPAAITPLQCITAVATEGAS
ncbi:hypothetical protein ACFQ7F_30560 [Streptomyces sp. NPDC056486]|uniref:hypothetical protein n=1 Tax=Streptomyces sp. NPDC056486 TaxID=3345835 RepID=UPI0036A9FACB